jgi:hypothetical protein
MNRDRHHQAMGGSLRLGHRFDHMHMRTVQVVQTYKQPIAFLGIKKLEGDTAMTPIGRETSRQITLWMSIFLVFSARYVCAETAETAYFRVSNGEPSQDFVIALDDSKKIKDARTILAGRQTDETHVQGKIVSEMVSYNRPGATSPPWSFHLDPASIVFFSKAPQGCNKRTAFVEEHVKKGDIGKYLFPISTWCPWASKIVAETTSDELRSSVPLHR